MCPLDLVLKTSVWGSTLLCLVGPKTKRGSHKIPMFEPQTRMALLPPPSNWCWLNLSTGNIWPSSILYLTACWFQRRIYWGLNWQHQVDWLVLEWKILYWIWWRQPNHVGRWVAFWPWEGRDDDKDKACFPCLMCWQIIWHEKAVAQIQSNWLLPSDMPPVTPDLPKDPSRPVAPPSGKPPSMASSPFWSMPVLFQLMLLLHPLLPVLQWLLLLFQGLPLLQSLQLLPLQLHLIYRGSLGSMWTEGVPFPLFDSSDLRLQSCRLGGQWADPSKDS